MLLYGDFGCLDFPGLCAYCYGYSTVRKYYYLRAPNSKRAALLLALQLQLALVFFQKLAQIARHVQQPDPSLVIQRDRESPQPILAHPAEGGKSHLVILGWMVHGYPFEDSTDKIFATHHMD